ncbi:hypothetical protein Tco_1446169 [Tanacetum coccineum]
MHTRAFTSELVEQLEEPERTLNRRLRRNKRVSFEQRDERPENPREAAGCVVASTPGLAITIPATANEFAIKGNHLTLVKENQFDAFANEGSSNSDTDKIMARMDSMTMKMDAQYKEMKSRTECNHCKGNHCKGNHSTVDCNDDDTPMSREEEAKFMQTF